jgi:hypothetical protein
LTKSSRSATGTTFDNSSGVNNGAISILSVIGMNGAFTSVTGSEIGSPGVIATVVPEPASAIPCVAALGMLWRQRRRKMAIAGR